MKRTMWCARATISNHKFHARFSGMGAQMHKCESDCILLILLHILSRMMLSMVKNQRVFIRIDNLDMLMFIPCKIICYRWQYLVHMEVHRCLLCMGRYHNNRKMDNFKLH